MGQTLARTLLELENANYRGTGGVSENNRCMGFQPAFIDREIGTVYLSRFSAGRLAPCHLFDGLPSELVLARDVRGRAVRLAFGRVRVRASRAFLHPRRGGSAARVCSGGRRSAKSRGIVALGGVGNASPESSSEPSTSSGTRSVLRAGLRKSAWRSFFIRPEASAAGRKRLAKPLSVGEMIVAQEDPLVAALHARHDRLRAAEFERARRQRAAERY